MKEMETKMETPTSSPSTPIILLSFVLVNLIILLPRKLLSPHSQHVVNLCLEKEAVPYKAQTTRGR